MEVTLLLSKVFGTYIIISGLVMLARKKYFVPTFALFVKERLQRILMAFIELLAGLFLIFTHFDFSSFAAGIITVLGVIAVVESIVYMSLSDKILTKILDKINKESLYAWWSFFAIVLGSYLIAYGFGMI